MDTPLAPVVRTPASLTGSGYVGGLTTRLGFPAGDDEPEVGRARIREVLAGAIGHDVDSFAWAKQVHGARVLEVTTPGLQGEADALVCTDPSLALLVAVADCCPVLLWDTGAVVFGVAHAGWRGVIAGVLPAAVEALIRLGASAHRLRAWIGPSIGVSHFEVGEEVAAEFDDDFVVRREDWPRPHVDLKAATEAALLAAGIEAGKVEVSADCTFKREDMYFSYRRDSGICGRHLGYLKRA